MHTSLVRRLSLGALIFGASFGTAYAVPVTYDLSGTGSVCTDLGATCVSNVAFTGSVTFDVDPAGPTGSDAFVYDDGSSAQASDNDSWVISTLSFSWAGGSFSDRVVANETEHSSYAEVVSNPSEEHLLTSNASVRDVTYGDLHDVEVNQGGIDLYSYDGSTRIFPDVTAFPLLTNLPAETPPWQLYVSLFDYAFTEQDSNILSTSGYQASFLATSIVERAAAVPEPATLALCLTGLVMLFRTRRRQLSRALS
jgi:hypothetical protein